MKRKAVTLLEDLLDEHEEETACGDWSGAANSINRDMCANHQTKSKPSGKEGIFSSSLEATFSSKYVEVGDRSKVLFKKRAKKGDNTSDVQFCDPTVLQSHGCTVEFLTSDSWVAHFPAFYVPTAEEFDSLWSQHPSSFKSIKLFGKETFIPRFQQSYGRPYSYSGSISESIPPTPLIEDLQGRLNELFSFAPDRGFNMCLCNWYEPQHYIGPHSDDTRQFVNSLAPIASLSWGYARVFALTPKCGKGSSARRKEFVLSNGDLIIMGGACQSTHKHEVLKLKKSEQQDGRNRINFTFRCFK